MGSFSETRSQPEASDSSFDFEEVTRDLTSSSEGEYEAKMLMGSRPRLQAFLEATGDACHVSSEKLKDAEDSLSICDQKTEASLSHAQTMDSSIFGRFDS